jgi:hypothetical protein
MKWSSEQSRFEAVFGFGSSTVTLTLSNRTVVRRETSCKIIRLPLSRGAGFDGGDLAEMLGEAVVACDSREIEDMETGCKWAFAKALKAAAFTRAGRFDAWKAWHSVFSPNEPRALNLKIPKRFASLDSGPFQTAEARNCSLPSLSLPVIQPILELEADMGNGEVQSVKIGDIPASVGPSIIVGDRPAAQTVQIIGFAPEHHSNSALVGMGTLEPNAANAGRRKMSPPLINTKPVAAQ